MNYPASITDFFKTPKWGMNLLQGAVSAIIPVVGVMVLMGWLFKGFWTRKEESAETFPDFNFAKFGKYLESGLWPALVLIIAGVIIIPVFIVVGIAAVMMAGSGSGSSFFVGMFTNTVVLAVWAVLTAVLVPMILRAGLLQDFGSAFDMPFLKRFVELTKAELAISVLFMAAVHFVVLFFGKLMCIGMVLVLASVPVIMYAWLHLSKQLYTLYVSRGGEPLTVSPKLEDAPEALPPPDAPPPPEPPAPPAV